MRNPILLLLFFLLAFTACKPNEPSLTGELEVPIADRDKIDWNAGVHLYVIDGGAHHFKRLSYDPSGTLKMDLLYGNYMLVYNSSTFGEREVLFQIMPGKTTKVPI